LSIFGGDDFKLESSLRRLAAQVSMASMESMAMVAAVQCDGNGSICFSSAAKAHVACTVPIIMRPQSVLFVVVVSNNNKRALHTVAACGH